MITSHLRRTISNLLFGLALSGLPFAASAEAAKPVPRFEDYPEKTRYTGHPAAPRLDSPLARKFRTVLRDGAAQGPNFAGHFTVVEWGCGSGCRQLAIVDARSGKVIAMPFTTLALPLTADSDPDGAREAPPEEYRPDSRLLALRGCRDEDEARCGTHYFVLEGTALKELAFLAWPPARSGEPGASPSGSTSPGGTPVAPGRVIRGEFNTFVGGAYVPAPGAR